MSTLIELDRSMELVAILADTLEQQVGLCPVSRMRLVTWVVNRFEDVAALEHCAQDLPQLPFALRSAYAEWTRSLTADEHQ